MFVIYHNSFRKLSNKITQLIELKWNIDILCTITLQFTADQSSVNNQDLPTGTKSLIYKQVNLINFKLSAHTYRELTGKGKSPITEKIILKL